MDGKTDGRMDRKINEWNGGGVGGRIGEVKDGWNDGQMAELMGTLTDK